MFVPHISPSHAPLLTVCHRIALVSRLSTDTFVEQLMCELLVLVASNAIVM